MTSALCEQEKIHQQLHLECLEVKSEASPDLPLRSKQPEKTLLTPEAAREKRLKYHREYYRIYRATHREQHRASVKRCRERHKEQYAARRRELYKLRRKEIVARKCELMKTPKYRSRANAYLRRRRREHVQFSLADRMRATINRAFRRNWIEKPHRTEAFIGCTVSDLKSHIERQFVNGMCWENRKSFVIDHIIPVAAFDLRDNEESMLAFNWRNLRPITWHDNAVKSDTLPEPLPSWLPTHIADRIKARYAKPSCC